MQYILLFEQFISESDTSLKDEILRIKIPKELKEDAVNYIGSHTKLAKGTKNGTAITGLELHPDLKAKISEKGLPDGFDMGIDKNGYYIHTHRARCKSCESPSKIPVKDIKFIDSTG